MSAPVSASVSGVMLTRRARGGDRSRCVEDRDGNVVEVWDFFQRSEGAVEGVAALG